MIGNRASARTRAAAAIALAAATIGCDDRVEWRRVVSRPLTPALLPPAAPSDSDSALADDSGFTALLTLDGRSEWRYFLAPNELANGPLAPDDPFVSSLDDRRRAAGLATLHLPPFVGAAFWLPIVPERPWRVEVEADYGDGSALAATVVLLSQPHPPLPDHVAPGTIRSRLHGELVDRTVLPLPAPGTVARATITPNAGADSALLLLSNHAERFERVSKVRILESTNYHGLLAANAIDASGFATLEIGGGKCRALVIPPGRSRATAELSIPRDAVLSGRARSLEGDETKPTEFSLEIELRGSEPSAESTRLPITALGDGGSFTVDLAQFAGRRATLRFHSNRDALALGDVAIAARSQPLAPVLVFVLDGVTLERWRLARQTGARTPILDSLVVADPGAAVGAAIRLADLLRDRVAPGRRSFVVSRGPENDALAIGAHVSAGDALEEARLGNGSATDPIAEALARLIGTDSVPSVIVLRTDTLAAVIESGDPERVEDSFAILDRRAGDFVRRAIDLGIADTIEFVVLLASGDGYLALSRPASAR